MRIYTVGVARIARAHTGQEFEIDADMLDWGIASSDEEPMGTRTLYEAVIEHPELGTLIWCLWEYPAGAEESRDRDLGPHTLLEDFDFGFEHELDGEEPVPLKYYSDKDQDRGVTSGTLQRLSSANQVPYLTLWFQGRYVDPAQETSYNGREGGYLWNHGGPYDARDELEAEFGRIAAESAIEAAVEEVESEGILEWAGGGGHPDRADEGFEFDEPEPEDDLDRVVRLLADGVQPVFGSEREQSLRDEVFTGILELEMHLPSPHAEHGGIGHNNPPADQQFAAAELAELREAMAVVGAQMAERAPDVKVVAEKTKWLREFGRWLRSKLDVAANTVVESGTTVAIAAAVGGAPTILEWVFKITRSLVSWLGSIMPF